MRKLFSLLFILLMTTAIQARKPDPVLQQAAAKIDSVLQSKHWLFVPREASFPRTITYRNMDEETNYFSVEDDNFSLRFDYTGTYVTHALADEQVMELAYENSKLYGLLEMTAPFFLADGELTNMKVNISRNCQTVTVRVQCMVRNCNESGYNPLASLVIYIDTSSMDATFVFHGLHYDEKYYGTFYAVEP